MSMPLAGYSGTPLVKKLGIKPDTTVALVAAPRGFRRELVNLPKSVRLVTKTSDPADLVIWFVTSRKDLESGVAGAGRQMTSGLWVAWPKKASGVVTDVTEDVVRAAGLSNGLVGYKVCAVNAIWSGLKFARRKTG